MSETPPAIDSNRAFVPGVMLLACAVLQVLYGLLSLFFASFGILGSLVIAGLFAADFADLQSSMPTASVIQYVLSLGVEVLGVFVWLTLSGAAIIPARGGLALLDGGDRKTIEQGAKAAALLPVAWFGFGALHALLQLDCFGLFLGNLPAVLLEVLGLITWVMTRNLLEDGGDAGGW